MNRTDESANDIQTCRIHCVHSDIVDSVREKMGPKEDLHGLTDLFKALSDYTRVHILNALSVSEMCVCDLAELLSMTPSAVSHQLRVLRAAKIVKFRKQGKMVFYSLDDDHVRRLLKEGLTHIGECR